MYRLPVGWGGGRNSVIRLKLDGTPPLPTLGHRLPHHRRQRRGKNPSTYSIWGNGVLLRKMQYALDTIQSVSGGLACVCVCVRLRLSVFVRHVMRKRRASAGSPHRTSLQAYLPDERGPLCRPPGGAEAGLKPTRFANTRQRQMRTGRPVMSELSGRLTGSLSRSSERDFPSPRPSQCMTWSAPPCRLALASTSHESDPDVT